jgi:carotenoid cleavage dioxygenase-like enzyme
LKCSFVHAAGEAHFIAKPASPTSEVAGTVAGGRAEDDGVVMASGVDEFGKAVLVMLDAAKWDEIARAELPYSTPYRFHGVWLPPQA